MNTTSENTPQLETCHGCQRIVREDMTHAPNCTRLENHQTPHADLNDFDGVLKASNLLLYELSNLPKSIARDNAMLSLQEVILWAGIAFK